MNSPAAEPKGNWEEAVVWLRGQPAQHQLVLDAFYDDPLIGAAQRYFETGEWKAVSELLRGRSGTALDVGAGRGIASYALAREGFAVTALEPDPSPIVGAAAIRALAAESGSNIKVVEEFSERLPFSDVAFDVVFARAVLHHTRDLGQACKEFYRVLKPGGIFIAAREHVLTHEADLGQFLEKHPLHKLYGGEHAYLLRNYVAALKTAGFSSLDVLLPLQSPINLHPDTLDTLREKISARLGKIVPFALTKTALGSDSVFRGFLRAAGVFDNRPGRLYSFVGRKAVS